MATTIPAKQLQTFGNLDGLKDRLLPRETGWCIEDSTLYIKKEDDSLAPVVPAQDLVDIEKKRAIAAEAENAEAIATEISDRTDADAEIITSLEDETTARRVNDELLQQQIEAVAVQTDWAQDDIMALDYLKNKPTTITGAEIEALFI